MSILQQIWVKGARTSKTTRNTPKTAQWVRPNGLRYPLVGGTGQRHFDRTNLKPRERLENAATPTSLSLAFFQGRVHAVLGGRTQLGLYLAMVLGKPPLCCPAHDPLGPRSMRQQLSR